MPSVRSRKRSALAEGSPYGLIPDTMVRITDRRKSRCVDEALGFRFNRDMDIVRDGELEATNYFYSIGDAENVLELTFNHDGRTYELGTGYGTSRSVSMHSTARSGSLPTRASSPSVRPTRWSRASSRICFVRDPDRVATIAN